MGFQSILTTITTYFQSYATTNNWTVRYDNDDTEIQNSGLHLEFGLEFEDSVQKEIAINSYRNFGNVVIQVKNDIGLGIGGVLATVDTIATLFRSKNLGSIVFRVPRVIKIGRVDDLYQINIVCPFYIDN